MKGKLGVHNLLFTDDWNEKNARNACELAARAGFDLIEVLVFDPLTLDVEMTRRVVAEAGLELRLGMALVPDCDISSTDHRIANAGIATVERCLQIASELEVPAVSGITYAAFNVYDAPPTNAQREQVIESFTHLDRRAAELGVRLGLEPVNRYESYMVNTLDEAAAMIRAAGGQNLFVHMDTFHMNIEEADLAGTILRNSDLLGYAHVADNNRGLIGAGSFDFKTYFRALAQVGYQGDFTVESFSPAVLGEDIVGAVSLWRTPWTDIESAARQALEFMRNEIDAAASSLQTW